MILMKDNAQVYHASTFENHKKKIVETLYTFLPLSDKTVIVIYQSHRQSGNEGG